MKHEIRESSHSCFKDKTGSTRYIDDDFPSESSQGLTHIGENPSVFPTLIGSPLFLVKRDSGIAVGDEVIFHFKDRTNKTHKPIEKIIVYRAATYDSFMILLELK